MEFNPVEKLHLTFFRLMQDIEEVKCIAWADAKSDADRQAVRDFEFDVNDAIRTKDVQQQIDNLRRVIEKYGIQV